MITGLVPQIRVVRDQGGVARRVITQDLLLPVDINSEELFNWLGRPQEKIERILGMERQTQLSAEGRPITERINVFGAYTVINNYDPKTGEYLGSLLEVEE